MHIQYCIKQICTSLKKNFLYSRVSLNIRLQLLITVIRTYCYSYTAKKVLCFGSYGRYNIRNLWTFMKLELSGFLRRNEFSSDKIQELQPAGDCIMSYRWRCGHTASKKNDSWHLHITHTHTHTHTHTLNTHTRTPLVSKVNTDKFSLITTHPNYLPWHQVLA